MANTKSAKKQIRVAGRKADRNLNSRKQFRDARKEVKFLLTRKSKDGDVAAALATFYKKVDKAAKENAISKNAAARYKSRLTSLVNSK